LRDAQPSSEVELLDVDAYDPSNVRPLRQTIANFLTGVPLSTNPRDRHESFWTFGLAPVMSLERRRSSRQPSESRAFNPSLCDRIPHENSAKWMPQSGTKRYTNSLPKATPTSIGLDGPNIISYRQCLTYDTRDVSPSRSLRCPSFSRKKTQRRRARRMTAICYSSGLISIFRTARFTSKVSSPKVCWPTRPSSWLRSNTIRKANSWSAQ